jgi:hypothetical protein
MAIAQVPCDTMTPAERTEPVPQRQMVGGHAGA